MRFVYPDVSVDKTLMIDRFRRSDQSNIVFFNYAGRSAGFNTGLLLCLLM